ncbi:MAG TPA: TetR family transcriptional regulator [Candidatus Limnocylindria bacterium]|nr:TetR family transcriptional regulator [Candidatus Limnocylindria bacterium]
MTSSADGTKRSLRQRKRAATEQAIVDAAMKLFALRGYAGTTVDDIAAAAGVARRTLFRYFPTKEDILLDPRRLDREGMLAGLRERRVGEDDLARVLRVLATMQARAFAMFRPSHQRVLHRLSHRELAGRTLTLMQLSRDVIVEGLVPRRATRDERLRARVLAMACVVAVDAAITTWIESGMKDDLQKLVAQAGGHLREGLSRRA